MSRTTWGSPKQGLVTLLTLVLIGVGMVAVAPAPADAAQSKPAGGYRTQATPGWIGAYKVRGSKAYSISSFKQVSGTYGTARRGALSPKRARAAWILSKYGARGTRLQAAAVDAAVLHLLGNKSFKLNGRTGAARIRQIGQDQRYVRSYAKQMLALSSTQAGPYKTSLTSAGPVAAGSGAKLTYTIRSRTGAGLFGIPVAFAYADGARRIAYTNKAGAATITVNAVAGTQTARATALQMPDWRMLVSRPNRRGAAPVAIAGRTLTLTSSTTVVGTTVQTVTVRNASTAFMTGEPLTGSYAVEGGSGERAVQIAVYGPTTSVDLRCAGTAKQTWNGTASGSSTVAPLPAFVASSTGYYRWGVTVSANESTAASSTCGPIVRVQRRATINQVRPPSVQTTVRVGRDFGVDVAIDGFDRAETHQVWSRLYGPFNTREAAKCLERRQLRRVTRNVPGNGQYSMPRIVANSADVGRYFVWSSTLSAGNFILGNTTGCGIVVKVVQ